MISKVTLMELYKDVFRRSALISIPNLSNILKVPNSEFTEWEIFYSIVRDALKEFEYYYPHTMVERAWLEVDATTRKARIQDNFKAYLNGVVSEDQICLVPAAVTGISNSYYTISTYPLRAFKYQTGEFTDFWYSSNLYYLVGIFKRPFFEEYDTVTTKPTDRCAIYYMDKDADSIYSIFRDELYRTTCNYILTMKKNMMLQNMPIELFGGIEESVNKLEGKLENIYQQASNNAYWIL